MSGPGLRRAEQGRLAFACLILALLAGYVALHFRITTDIHHFLPASETREIGMLSREIAESELSRTMILAVEAPDRETAIQVSRRFEAALRLDDRVGRAISFLEGGPREGLEQALFELYQPRQLYFLGRSEKEVRALISDDGLRRTARRLRDELGGPMSALVTRLAASDPFLTLTSLFKRLERSRASDLTVVDGRFLTRDGRTAILFLGTVDSALDARAQAPLLEGVSQVWTQVAADFPDSVRLDQSGLNRFATRTALAIESDIKRVSLVSSLLIGGFLFWLFRSLRFVALAAIPVGSGVLAGMAAVLAVFGQVHGVTLAFGAALIGVSVDYVVHLYCHHAVVMPSGGARASIRAITRPLATGAVTTVAGFAALFASSLVGLREVALFAVSGIVMAFVVTVVILPPLIPSNVTRVRARDRLVAGVTDGFSFLKAKRRALLIIPFVATAFVAFALPDARWNPDLGSLARMDPTLLAEDERVREKVARFEQALLVVALGDRESEALEVNDRVDASLTEAVSSGELGGHLSLAPLLPSPRRQSEVARAATGDASLPERVRRVFGEEGFSPNAFDPFLESLSSPLPTPLSYADLQGSPLAGFVRSHRLLLGDRIGFVTFLHGVTDSSAIDARVAEIPGAVFLKQSELLNQAQLQYQRNTLELLGWGLCAVLALLAIRYRDWRRTLVAFLPSILAAAMTISVLTFAGRGIDLISLTALLFVVSMGVDYSVFLVDAYDEGKAQNVAAALTGALLAGVSTLVAFGLLALSEHPVLADLGLTAAVGIGTSLLMAPLVLVLLGPRKPGMNSNRSES